MLKVEEKLRAGKFKKFKCNWYIFNICFSQEQLLPVLLRMIRLKDKVLQEQVREALCLIGYIEPVTGRGIRLLSMDGGGTRYSIVAFVTETFLRNGKNTSKIIILNLVIKIKFWSKS